MPHAVDRMLLTLAVWFAASPAPACSCMAIALESQIDEAETILVARVVSVEDMAAAEHLPHRHPAEAYPPDGEYGLRAHFTVLRALKQRGPLPETLRTGYGGGDCGFELLPGHNYLILTHARGGVSSCSGSRLTGFQDGVSCRMQTQLAAIERRIADRQSEIPLPADNDYAPWLVLDDRVREALESGRTAFEAGCEASPHQQQSPDSQGMPGRRIAG